MMPGWVIQRAGALPGDDGQLLILDRKDGLNGRTVCVVPGNLFWNKTGGDLVRLLDEDDLANATLLAAAKPMRDALQALVAWQARVGGVNDPAWDEARALLARLRGRAGHQGGRS